MKKQLLEEMRGLKMPRKKEINHPNKGPTEYLIYDKEEADELGIPYVAWWKAKVGEYGLTDDDVVLKLISKKTYQASGGGESEYFTFPIGSVFRSKKYKSKKFLIKNIRGHHLTSNKSRNDKWAQTDVGKQLAMLYAQIPETSFVIDKVLGEHSKNAHTRWQKYMKTEVFTKMVREEIGKLLTEKGFSEGEVLDLLRETIDLSKEKRSQATLLRSVEVLLDMHGMRNQDKVKRTESIEATRKELIDNINSTEEKVVLKRETEGGRENIIGTTKTP